MNRRTLGVSGFTVGEVGLGGWQFSGDFGAMSESTVRDVLEAAVAQGVDFIDTADIYGGGESERRIGAFLRSCDRPIRVATKFGRDASVYPDRYSESALQNSIEASCQRLGVETLDLLQLHCVPLAVLRDGEIFDWLRRAKAAGLIRAFGASVETIEEGLVCLEQEGLSSLQVIFNIFRQRMIDQLFPQALAKGVGIIVRLPLASGLLAGKYRKDAQFEPGDHRNYNRDGQCFSVGETFAGLPFEKGVDLAEAVRGFLPAEGDMAQQALRWILDHEAVSVVIPGARSVAQVRANAAASALPPLPAATHRALAAMYESQIQAHIRGVY